MKIIAPYICVLLIFSNLHAARQKEKNALLILDREFFSRFLSVEPIKRDRYLDELLNKIVQGRGYIESISRLKRYNKTFRITVADSEAANITVRYNIFTNSEDYQNILKRSDLFEFRGQLILYTPLNLKKDSYIFDVILSDGALVVK